MGLYRVMTRACRQRLQNAANNLTRRASRSTAGLLQIAMRQALPGAVTCSIMSQVQAPGLDRALAPWIRDPAASIPPDLQRKMPALRRAASKSPLFMPAFVSLNNKPGLALSASAGNA